MRALDFFIFLQLYHRPITIVFNCYEWSYKTPDMYLKTYVTYHILFLYDLEMFWKSANSLTRNALCMPLIFYFL
jgi:hypothetical protein